MEQDQSQGGGGAQEARKERVAEAGRFREAVYRHYRDHGRRFSWRATRDPYAIVVSELMLQQTQTERVREKHREFLKRFPDYRSLSQAPLREVLQLWQGLGYNRRARYLQQIAAIVSTRYGGVLPQDPQLLRSLPGIGAATAGSLMAFVYNLPVVFIETNIRRAVIEWFFPNREQVSDRELWPILEAALDRRNPRQWYYALMDYGAALGRNRRENANRRSRHYTTQTPFEGSRRQRRGQVLRLLTAAERVAVEQLYRELPEPQELTREALDGLAREGFIVQEPDGSFRLGS